MNILLPTQNLKTRSLTIKDGILILKYGQSFQNVIYDLTYFMKGRNFCYYCKRKMPKSQLTMDHMYPRSTGGPTLTQNLIPSCKKCNSEKSDMTFQQYMVFRSFKSKAERKAYATAIAALKQELKLCGVYEIPSNWYTYVNTDDIHTCIDFANISETKYNKVKSYLDEYGSFQVPMVLDRNLYSLDGFYNLFVAKSLGIAKIPAIILDNVEIRIKS